MIEKVVPVTLAATFAIQLGYFCWKLAAMRPAAARATRPLSILLSTLAQGWWWCGTLGTSIGWGLFVWATTLGDVSVVQPLMSAGDLFLVLLAVVFLGERLVLREWLGVGCMVAGALALSLESAPTGTPALSWPAFGCVCGGCVLGGLILLRRGFRRPDATVLLAIVVGLGFGLGAIATKAVTLEAAQAGGGMSAVLSLLTHPVTLIVVLANAAGLVLLQVAFRKGRAAVIVPVQLGVVNLLAMFAGAWVFAEDITLGRVTGALLVCIGAVVLSRRHERTSAGRQQWQKTELA